MVYFIKIRRRSKKANEVFLIGKSQKSSKSLEKLKAFQTLGAAKTAISKWQKPKDELEAKMDITSGSIVDYSGIAIDIDFPVEEWGKKWKEYPNGNFIQLSDVYDIEIVGYELKESKVVEKIILENNKA